MTIFGERGILYGVTIRPPSFSLRFLEGKAQLGQPLDGIRVSLLISSEMAPPIDLLKITNFPIREHQHLESVNDDRTWQIGLLSTVGPGRGTLAHLGYSCLAQGGAASWIQPLRIMRPGCESLSASSLWVCHFSRSKSSSISCPVELVESWPSSPNTLARLSSQVLPFPANEAILDKPFLLLGAFFLRRAKWYCTRLLHPASTSKL